MVKAQIGDVMKVEIRNHNPRTIIITLTTQKQADYANQLLNDPSSGWQLEKSLPAVNDATTSKETLDAWIKGADDLIESGVATDMIAVCPVALRRVCREVLDQREHGEKCPHGTSYAACRQGCPPWRVPSPALLAYEQAMQSAGVPREPLEVYTSNSWVRVGIAKKYREAMTPDTRLDTRSASVLEALVAAFNAMLELRKEPQS